MTRKLGKLPARRDPRTLYLAKYLSGKLAPWIPESIDWSSKVTQPWGMLGNDAVGDCTIAAAMHCVMLWLANAGTIASFADAQAIAVYEAVTGYNPADPSTDQGAVEMDVLNYWRQTGIAGHKIGAYVALSTGNNTELKQAITEFEAVYVGVSLPITAQNQDVWDVVNGSGANGVAGSWGGHAVPLMGYDDTGYIVVTWGALKHMTYAFANTYLDEAYAAVSQDMLDGIGESPVGLNLAQLQEDLAEVTA